MESGKFIVRLDKSSHSLLKVLAKKNGISLNELCSRRLAASSADMLPPHILSAVIKLSFIASEQLLGLIVFGSWARGDAHAQSDVDILIVLHPTAKIDRSLYHQWEEVCEGSDKIEPHFVTLPNLGGRVSGLWAEMAIDGIVIADPTLQVQRYLLSVRQLISQGKMIQKRIHGQNYWIHVEAA